MERDIPLTPDQIDEAERRSDQGVWNGAMAEAAVTGYFAEKPVDEDAPRAAPRSPEHKATSKRKQPHGVSGQEMTRRFDNETTPLDPDQRDAIRREMGHILFVVGKHELAYQNAVKKADGDPRVLAILLRKLADGEK